MKSVSPGWYAASSAVVELVPDLLRSAPTTQPPGHVDLLYVYVTAETRSRFYAAADRCSRYVHRLSEAEVERRRLSVEPDPLTIDATKPQTLFFDDRAYLSEWLAAYRRDNRNRSIASPDRGTAAAFAAPDPHPRYRLAWVASPNHRIVYLRLHGRERSDLAFRYCSPFRTPDDLELVSFRSAVGATTSPSNRSTLSTSEDQVRQLATADRLTWAPCPEAL